MEGYSCDRSIFKIINDFLFKNKFIVKNLNSFSKLIVILWFILFFIFTKLYNFYYFNINKS